MARLPQERLVPYLERQQQVKVSEVMLAAVFVKLKEAADIFLPEIVG